MEEISMSIKEVLNAPLQHEYECININQNISFEIEYFNNILMIF